MCMSKLKQLSVEKITESTRTGILSLNTMVGNKHRLGTDLFFRINSD